MINPIGNELTWFGIAPENDGGLAASIHSFFNLNYLKFEILLSHLYQLLKVICHY